jgi:hypothetical protein
MRYQKRFKVCRRNFKLLTLYLKQQHETKNTTMELLDGKRVSDDIKKRNNRRSEFK